MKVENFLDHYMMLLVFNRVASAVLVWLQPFGEGPLGCLEFLRAPDSRWAQARQMLPPPAQPVATGLSTLALLRAGA